MSRKELEDKYLTLLEQHLQLKLDLNSREERLKLLSTKLQRVSNQHKSENSCACKYSGKVTHTLQDVIARQKYKIEDLEMKNLGLLERIRILKMNLSTQRQFLGTIGSMKRFHSVSGDGSLSTGRKPQSHRSVQSIKHLEKMISPSSSSKSSSMKELIEIGVDLNETVDIINSGKVSKEIQTNDEEIQAQVNLTKELHNKISHLEKELKNVEIKYNKRIFSLEEEQKSLLIERDVALSSAKESGRQQQEQAQCWNKVTAEQLREILHRNSELIIQLSMERKKVYDLELKLKECLYTTQLVDLVYDRLKNNKYICSVCKTSQQVDERNGPESTKHIDLRHPPIENNCQHIIETDIQNDNPKTAVEKLNTILNGRVAEDNKDNCFKDLLSSEVPDRDREVMENDSCGSKTLPLPLTMIPERDETLQSLVKEEDITGMTKDCISNHANHKTEEIKTISKEFSVRRGTPLIIKVPSTSTSVHSEDDDDVVTETKGDSEDTKNMVKIDTFDDAQGISYVEHFEDISKIQDVSRRKKSKDKISPTSSKTSQLTESISQGTYTVQKHENNEYSIHGSDGIDQNEPRNIPSKVSDDTEVGSPWQQEDDQCQYETGRQSSSMSDSSYSDVTLSEGERPGLNDTTTSIDESSHIQSSGWSQQFKSSGRSQNTSPDINPDEVCVLDRAKRILSAVSEVLTECRDLQGKARIMSADC